MKMRIVADSSANLKTREDKSLISVPLKLVTDQKEYVDDENLDVKLMADELAAYKGRSGSACPGVGDWIEAFGGEKNVFGITITSNLSGCYNAAKVAEEQYLEENPDANVYIVDSLSTGPEMGLIVEKLEELAAEGLSFEEIRERIKEYQKKTHLFFELKSLTNLANNGRVSPAVAKLAGFIGLHLVGKASDVGTLEPTDKVRGEKKAIVTIFKNMKEHGYCGGKVRIDHCFNEEAAKSLEAKIREEYKDADVQIGQCTGLCTFYAEIGGMLVGFEG